MVVFFLFCILASFSYAEEKGLYPWLYTSDGESVTILATVIVFPNADPLVIPETIENLPVKKFGRSDINASYSGISGQTNIRSIVLPSTLEVIESRALEGLSNLTNITLPPNLKSIGYQAFRGSSNLTSINLPEGLTNIASGAFLECRKLNNIILPFGIKNLESWTFAQCNSLSTITLNSSLETIGDYAFLQCSALSSINIPSKVTSIGQQAFWQNSSLTNVILGKSVNWIGWEAFAHCSNLNKVIFRGSTPNGGVDPFYGSSGTVYYQNDIAGWGLKYPPVGYRGPNGLPTLAYTPSSAIPKIKKLEKTTNSFFIEWENEFEKSFEVKLPVSIQKKLSLGQTNWVNISENNTNSSYQDLNAINNSAFYRIQVP
jgi:hypothetical protein